MEKLLEYEEWKELSEGFINDNLETILFFSNGFEYYITPIKK